MPLRRVSVPRRVFGFFPANPFRSAVTPTVPKKKSRKKMLAARLAAQLPARRALVRYPVQARTFASKKSKRPQQDPSGSQPPASSQSSSEPSKEPLNADPSAPERAPATPGEIPDPKLSELPSLSTLDFTAADETPRSERTGARSAKDSPSSIERKTRLMSKLMIGVAALGLGAYAASLSGEWTEEELKEKKMVCSTLAFSCAVTNYDTCSAFHRHWRTLLRRDGDEQWRELAACSMYAVTSTTRRERV